MLLRDAWENVFSTQKDHAESPMHGDEALASLLPESCCFLSLTGPSVDAYVKCV